MTRPGQARKDLMELWSCFLQISASNMFNRNSLVSLRSSATTGWGGDGGEKRDLWVGRGINEKDLPSSIPLSIGNLSNSDGNDNDNT